MEKYIGKVILVNIPSNKRPRYRWIVKKREDDRYIVRNPKIGILIRELNLKRNKDFGKEELLPLGSKPYIIPKTMKSKKKRKIKTKKIKN